MIVLDAYAVIAVLGNERAASDVVKLLRSGQSAISVLNLAEVLDTLGRQGVAREPVMAGVENLIAGGLATVAVHRATAELAAGLRIGHYNREKSALSLADCVALATCLSSNPVGSLATADPPLAAAALKEGIRVIALPDTRGRRPLTSRLQ